MASLDSGMVLTVPRESLMFLGRGLRVGTGRVIPSKFTPPMSSDTTRSLFPEGASPSGLPRRTTRFINRQRPDTFLVYTDGSCLNNGGTNPRAGCAFVFRDVSTTEFYHVEFPLEKEGPTGEEHVHTSNRAELRAVIAATRFREWTGEGFKTMVIATDSEYVVEGITTWIRQWLTRGWRTTGGHPVANRDLWECLLGEMERYDEEGMNIQFWRIPREWNTEADYHARTAAESNESSGGQFCDYSGALTL